MKDILIVDDSVFIQLGLKYTLEDCFKNTNVYVARDIQEADVMLAKHDNIGLVVSETYFNSSDQLDELEALCDKYHTKKFGILTTQEFDKSDKFIFKHEKPIEYIDVCKSIDKYL